MFVVGLTGGAGSGKSTVCRMFQQLGCIIIDTDYVAREVIEPGKPAWHEIRKEFGPGIFYFDGSLKKEIMGLILRGDEKKRRRLNEITYPQIYLAMIRRLIRHMLYGEQFVIIRLPLLFEEGMMTSLLHSTIVVSCAASEQVERIRARDGYSKEEAVDRVNGQIPLSEKCQMANYIIDNSGNGRTINHQVTELHLKLRSSYDHWVVRFQILMMLSLPVCIVLIAYWKNSEMMSAFAS